MCSFLRTWWGTTCCELTVLYSVYRTRSVREWHQPSSRKVCSSSSYSKLLANGISGGHYSTVVDESRLCDVPSRTSLIAPLYLTLWVSLFACQGYLDTFILFIKFLKLNITSGHGEARISRFHVFPSLFLRERVAFTWRSFRVLIRFRLQPVLLVDLYVTRGEYSVSSWRFRTFNFSIRHLLP